MASTSGTQDPPDNDWRELMRRILRASNKVVDLDDQTINEIRLSPLAELVPIFIAAPEIEEENPRVAYLCRFHAFEKAHKMDPTSSGRGVRQFKTYLLHKLKEEGELTEKFGGRSDARELQNYYQQFYEKKIQDGEYTQRPEEMAKNFQIAAVLYEVLKTVVAPQNIDEKIKRYAEDVENKRGQYEHYDILPLYAFGVKPAIMELPEIKAVINALRRMDNLPIPFIRASTHASNDDSTMPTERVKKVTDILDWIASVFGFQKGNVSNQREHLILLLANLNIRNRPESSNQLHEETVQNLMATIFKNYESWCHYVRCESNLRYLEGYDMQQIELIYIALYLLIWGEASNIRFMPECLCYIFHHMCHEVYNILEGPSLVTGSAELLVGRYDEYFLREVISPIYQVLMKEAKRNNKGKASHSNWRNYDDLNEYFWSKKCFGDLKWPWDPKADFFRHSDETHTRHRGRSQANTAVGRRKPKTNFVEVRTFLHLYRSFDRMWIFFILALQAIIIIAWSSLGPIGVFFDRDVFRNVMTIFITYAFLNFLQVTLDIILTWNALKNMKFTQLLRYFLKFVVAAVWVVVLPVCYSSSLQNPQGLIRFITSWAGDWGNQTLYTYVVVLYMLPNIVAAIMFFLPPLRRKLERSDMRLITLLMWWAQPKLYVGRGMHENMLSLLMYTLFWIMLLISKLAFSYYVEILPLVGPTKLIMGMSVDNNQWHEFFPENETRNIYVVIAIWAPIILVYFMDTQIWYAIYTTLFGGIVGAFSHLGEIRTLGMLCSRFQSLPVAFCMCFWTGRYRKTRQVELNETYERNNIAYFSQFWNEFIISMREEDLISNRERDLLLIPYGSNYVSVIQWPAFLLASKIPIAIDIAKDYKEEIDDQLFEIIKNDEYMCSAVVECYETFKHFILNLLQDEEDRQVVSSICAKVERCIREETFVKEFKMSGLPLLSKKLEKFLTLLQSEDGKLKSQIVYVLQDIVEIIIHDVIVDGHLFLQTPQQYHVDRAKWFVNIDTSFTHNGSVMEKVIRLHLIFTVKEPAINVSHNPEALRRITFFANSLFMNMPKAPTVRDMLSFSVLTPYFKEDVLYSDEELNSENEDGISILFYLSKIYPDEWANFHERLKSEGTLEEDKDELIRRWASCRGQTLYRTVKGMMYYWEVLILQGFIESAGDVALFTGYRTLSSDQNNKILEDAQAMADIKFTYVVSCQEFGSQKRSKNTRDRSCYTNILNLMLRHSCLRVAYIDEIEELTNGKSQKVYYSVLVKGGKKYDEITVLTVYVYLYGRLYMVLSGIKREIIQSANIHQSKTLEEALATKSLVQLGLLLVLPMLMEIGLEKGFCTALGDFIIMQLHLSSVFFTFQLGTKAHYYGRTLLHGGSKYQPTGHGFVVFHTKFADIYRMYSRSHFVKGLEILILLVVYEVYGESYHSSHLHLFITTSVWFLAISWLFAPFLFNPSGFDWQKTVDDWTDWKQWMVDCDGIGISSDKSWERWWDEENEFLKYSNIRGKILEIILALRFFVYQYGIVYHMDITHHNKDLRVFGLSWAVLIIIFIALKLVSVGRQRFGTDIQLMCRILKANRFLAFSAVLTVLFVVCGLTISDLFAAIIAFIPSGWAIILIAQACRGCFKGARLWDSVKQLARAYEYIMGLIIFLPTAILSWFPFVSEIQTRLLFNQAFSRGLQISMILAGKDTYKYD